MTEPALRACYLGRLPYERAYQLQNRLRQSVLAGGPEALLLLEHDPVITLGYAELLDGGLLCSREQIAARGIELVHSDRGGKTTYHGPGQLVGYLLLDLEQRRLPLRGLVELLQQTLIELVCSYSIRAFSREGLPGVWVGDSKVGFLGMNVKHAVTAHGFALNLNNDLTPFNLFVPCGLTDVPVTSLKRIKGQEFSLPEVARRFLDYFSEISGIRIEPIDPAELEG